MPYCTPPIVKSWSKKGEYPNTNPDRVERPMTNLIGAELVEPPSWPTGAYHRPSRSSRWKSPEPPSGPPDCEMPIECIVPAVGNGRSRRVSRSSDIQRVDRTHFWQASAAVVILPPMNVCSSIP